MAQISNKFAIYITLGRLITMLASFVMPLILVRFMTKSDYGVFSQFYTLYTALYVILALGQHSNLFYFYPSANKVERDKYVSNIFLLLLLFGFVGGILMYCPLISSFIFGDSVLGKYKEWIIVSIAFATPMNIVSPLNTVKEDKWGAMLLPGFIALLRIGTVIACTLVYNDLNQLFRWLFFYQLLIMGIVAIYSLYGVHFRIDGKLMKKQLVYSLPFGLAVTLQLLSNYFDKFICIKFLDPVQYAIYGIAFLSIPGVTQVYDSLCQVNIVNMSTSFRVGKIEEIAPQYRNFVVKTLSFSTPLILIVALYAEEIMTFLYTDQYVDAAPYFRLYSLTFLTSMFGAGTVLRSMGKTGMSLMAYIITCVVGLPSTYILVSKYSVNGAILGAMINMILPRIIQMIFEANALNLKFSYFLPWSKLGMVILPAIILLLPFVCIKFCLYPNIWLCILQSLIYVLLLYIYYINKELFILDKAYITIFINKFKNAKK